MNNSEISVKELKHKIDNHENIQLVDVREPSEYQIANIGGILIPLADLPHRLNELDQHKETAILCHSGGRSRRAVFILENAGFKKVFNITGGISAWSKEIDPSVPTY